MFDGPLQGVYKTILLRVLTFSFLFLGIINIAQAKNSGKNPGESFIAILPVTDALHTASGNLFVIKSQDQVHFFDCNLLQCKLFFSTPLEPLLAHINSRWIKLNANQYSKVASVGYQFSKYSQMSVELQETINTELAAVEDELSKVKLSHSLGYATIGIELVTVALNFIYDDDDLAANRLMQTVLSSSFNSEKSAVITIKGASYEDLLNIISFLKMELENKGKK